ncbi:hypothetical protein ACWKSR_10900, partial [Campylobacter fetus subsp. venerealis]
MKVPFFHTTNFKNYPKGVFEFNMTSEFNYLTVASKGDILLARVGSRCIGKFLVVLSGEIILSDCVYRIRVKKE